MNSHTLLQRYYFHILMDLHLSYEAKVFFK